MRKFRGDDVREKYNSVKNKSKNCCFTTSEKLKNNCSDSSSKFKNCCTIRTKKIKEKLSKKFKRKGKQQKLTVQQNTVALENINQKDFANFIDFVKQQDSETPLQLESIPEEIHIPENHSHPDTNFLQISESFKGSLGLQALNLK